MIKRKLLTAALVLVIAMSTAACSSTSHAAGSSDQKSLFEYSSDDKKNDKKHNDKDDDEDEKDEDDEDDEEEDEDKKDSKKDDKKDNKKDDKKDNKKDDKDDEEDEDDEEDKDDKKDNKKDDKKDNKKDDDEDDDESEEGLSQKEIVKKLGDDIKSAEFGADDAIYELPAKVKDFKKHGWKIDEVNSDEYLDKQRSGRVILTKGKKVLYLFVDNYDDYTINATDGTVTGIAVDEDYGTDVYLPAGISSGMDEDDLKDALKDNDIDYDVDDDSSFSTSYTIKAEETQIAIFVKKESGKVYQMQIYTYIKDTSDYEGAPEAEVETVDVESDYTAPKKISSADEFELMGDLYSLHAPVSAYLDNGWELEDTVNTDQQVSAGDNGSAILEKDDMEIQLLVENDEKGTVAIKDAVVQTVVAWHVPDFKLYHGIAGDDKLSSVKEALDDEKVEYDVYSSILTFEEDGADVSVATDDNKRVDGFKIGTAY